MKKILVIILSIIIPSLSVASDKFLKHKEIEWKTDINILPNIKLRSIFHMTKREVELFRSNYIYTRHMFERFSGIDIDNSEKLEIRIISINDLSNKKYFPNENTYSDNTGDVTGRYFRVTNTLYLVPRFRYFNWERSFAHELAHHFYDILGVNFNRNEVEHRIILKFESYF